jgi:uncharacterized protein YdiU (UPF0061 family)
VTPLVELPVDFDNSLARELHELTEEWEPAAVPHPEMVVLNQELAEDLGLDPGVLDGPDGVAVLAGNAVPTDTTPIAMAYAGHQFGGFSPLLGDGRALLIGEIIDPEGQRHDIHLKGSGRTPFARGGDGKATIGPMLREFVIAEAMQALGVPTTRALAVLTTGEDIMREGPEPGAVLTRVAASHLRVGTFEYAVRLEDTAVLGRLLDYAIDRHYPELADEPEKELRFLEAVIETQAELIARWMQLGFIHGVMNTDNMTISGQGIDYGPCAFMDRYDPSTVFSSIDHAGRYAYGNQPSAAQWNLARLAESLIGLVDPDTDVAIEKLTELLGTFPDRYRHHWNAGMRAKLGLTAQAGGDAEAEGDDHLITDLLDLLETQKLDYTSSFRALADSLREDGQSWQSTHSDPAAADTWTKAWRARLDNEGYDAAQVADAMDQVNPIYIPRNHLVEVALKAAENGDLEPFEQLLEVVTDPFEQRDDRARYAESAPEAFEQTFQTFCGT